MKFVSAIAEFMKDELKRDALLVVVSALSLIISFIMKNMDMIDPIWADPAWIAIVLCGIPILYEAVTGLVLRHDIKADVLVAMAIVASVIMGEYFAAGEVAFIMALGGLLEDYSAHRSRAGIESLIEMAPATARVMNDDGERIVPAKEVNIGERVRVLAGETVPLDGKVTEGTTSIDQSSLTGESMPVDKTLGDEVYSGTVNQMGTFEMEVTKTSSESSFQRLVDMVESADADKTQIVRTADRWATWLVAIVAAITVLTYIVFRDLSRALTVMIVFCPCAFILATPTAVVAAIGNLAKHGILVKDADSIERMSQVDRIAFDKTGTVTEGRPEVVSVTTLADMPSKEMLAYAASAESRSEHPLGKAITENVRSSGRKVPDPEDFKISVGGGVSATVNGRKVLVGSRKFLECSEVHVDRSLGTNGTTIFVAVDGTAVGLIGLADPVRPEAKGAVSRIRENGAECVMLTGDGKAVAESTAKAVGIMEIRAECRPEDKVETIMELKKDGHKVCMVGDGINDAPSLKTADVGIAMGGTGSGIAVDAADMVLVGDELVRIPHLQSVSSKMMSKIKTNIAFSMGWNFMAVALAVFGLVDPVIGAIVHNVGSVAVVVNSFLLLLYGRENASERSEGEEPPLCNGCARQHDLEEIGTVRGTVRCRSPGRWRYKLSTDHGPCDRTLR